jgi:hypothetical protein
MGGWTSYASPVARPSMRTDLGNPPNTRDPTAPHSCHILEPPVAQTNLPYRRLVVGGQFASSRATNNRSAGGLERIAERRGYFQRDSRGLRLLTRAPTPLNARLWCQRIRLAMSWRFARGRGRNTNPIGWTGRRVGGRRSAPLGFSSRASPRFT